MPIATMPFAFAVIEPSTVLPPNAKLVASVEEAAGVSFAAAKVAVFGVPTVTATFLSEPFATVRLPFEMPTAKSSEASSEAESSSTVTSPETARSLLSVSVVTPSFPVVPASSFVSPETVRSASSKEPFLTVRPSLPERSIAAVIEPFTSALSALPRARPPATLRTGALSPLKATSSPPSAEPTSVSVSPTVTLTDLTPSPSCSVRPPTVLSTTTEPCLSASAVTSVFSKI